MTTTKRAGSFAVTKANFGAEMGHSPLRGPLETETRLLIDYIHTVNAAALAFAFLFALKALAEGASSNVPFPAYIWSFAIPVLVMGGFFWIVAFFMALPPVALAYAVAAWCKLRSIFYYIACGAVTGFALTPVYVSMGPQQSWQNERSFSEDCLIWGPIFIICGICGAIAFWRRRGRHIGTPRSETPLPPYRRGAALDAVSVAADWDTRSALHRTSLTKSYRDRHPPERARSRAS